MTSRRFFAVSVFVATAMWMAFPARASAEGEFKLSTRTEGRTIVLAGENTHPCAPYYAVIKFKELVNYRASVPLPFRVVLPPGEVTDLFKLEVVNPRKGTGYSVTMKYGPGDPNIRLDRSQRYLLPYTHGTKHLVGQGYLGKFTHRKTYSLDFNMEEGTPVCAARDGVVFKVKADSNEGGLGVKFSQKANFIGVLHEDGTWTDYAHLRQNGVAVKIGERVKAGQVIGYSGNTGQSKGPHLHFAVAYATWEQNGTTPTAFVGQDDKAFSIEEGRWYYAYHPDGEPFAAVLGETLVEEDLEEHQQKIPLSGNVEFRTEQIDNKIMLYCRNGTGVSRNVTISFPKIVNLKSSKRVPLSMVVPSGIEMYVLTLTQRPGSGPASYELQYSSKMILK